MGKYEILSDAKVESLAECLAEDILERLDRGSPLDIFGSIRTMTSELRRVLAYFDWVRVVDKTSAIIAHDKLATAELSKILLAICRE